MKQTKKGKGSELEQAVRAIESAILQAAPGYSEGTFKIQSNKILKHKGVRHEIDIHVVASLAAGYESVFIFECKNWEAKVGKNELIVFSEKIAVSGAQSGFSVAKKFTRDARAQALQDPRIRLLTTRHFKPVGRVVFPQFHLLNIRGTDAKVTIRGFNDKGETKEIQLGEKMIKIGGVESSADQYVRKLIESARDTKLNKTATELLGDGAHEIVFSEIFEYAEGEAFIQSTPLKALEINGKVEVEVVLGSVLSVYEVDSRGSMLVVGASGHGIEVEAQVIQLSTTHSD